MATAHADSMDVDAPTQTRPFLERESRSNQGEIVQEKAQPDDLQRHRFGLDLKSICYYPAQNGGTRCAILLSTTFELKKGQKMAWANVPLGVRPAIVKPKVDSAAASSSTSSLPSNSLTPLELAAYHPSGEQRIVENYQKTKRTEIKPQVKFGALGAEVEAGGIGVETESTREASKSIALCPKRDLKTSDEIMIPDIVKWTYTSPHHSLHYPSNTQLILIAEKPDTTSWFPFTLHIRKDLVVDLHGEFDFSRAIVRLVGRSPPKEGWTFRINGNYNPKEVKDMIRLDRHEIDRLVGLKVVPQ